MAKQQVKLESLPLVGRFYIYAIHGWATEIMFTALWDLVVNGNPTLPGVTSLWAFPIYGLSALMVERLYLCMLGRGVPLVARGLVYTLWTYVWEFSTGLVLTQFGACPWDYSAFHAHFMGLVTLEYMPLWFGASLVLETFLIRYTQRVYLEPSSETLENRQTLKESGD